MGFICDELQELNVMDRIPENGEFRDCLINHAINIRAALMKYLAFIMRIEISLFRIVVNIINT